MKIDMKDLLGKTYWELEHDNVQEIDTDDFMGCDIIAISHSGPDIIKAYKAYYTDSTKSEIVVCDPTHFRATFDNYIQLKHVKEINGVKVTFITMNIASDFRATGHKFYHIDNWLY